MLGVLTPGGCRDESAEPTQRAISDAGRDSAPPTVAVEEVSTTTTELAPERPKQAPTRPPIPGDDPVIGFEKMQTNFIKNLYVWSNGLIVFDRGSVRKWARVPEGHVEAALAQLVQIGVFSDDLLRGMVVPDGGASTMWAIAEDDTWRTASCHEFYAHRRDVVVSESGIGPAREAEPPSEDWRHFVDTWRKAKRIMCALIPETAHRYKGLSSPSDPGAGGGS